MEQMGIPVKKIHAGHANMFLSSIFRDTLAGVTGATIELYDTDGSVGAAKGAGIGAGIYKDNNEAFATLDKLDVIEPNIAKRQEYADAYARWKYNINNDIITFLNNKNYGNKRIFSGIEKIKFEGKDSKNPMAFRYYDAEKVINGKKMKDWLRFAMAWWHIVR